jgi:hypothetical protein
MAYTLDTTAGTLPDDTGAVKILEKHAPGITSNPMLRFAKGMTLNALPAMPQAKQFGVTEKMVTDVLNEINALHKQGDNHFAAKTLTWESKAIDSGVESNPSRDRLQSISEAKAIHPEIESNPFPNRLQSTGESNCFV